ncbi:hypothetical protein E3N88_08773 [Mikania micrantha]|uniref:Cupin type-1 domain-containing protein n=1 Tax=Mikania micrantha TaxID=192012 RepID=A0A5N6PI50_9ASTR|nr:hypothetical protein E3N88_08773 [Mikania micrantha]
MMSRFLILSLLLATCAIAFASDPSPLQDFCVADPKNSVLVNGVVCKDPKLVKADDFLFRGLNMMGNTSNDVGSNVTPVTVADVIILPPVTPSSLWSKRSSSRGSLSSLGNHQSRLPRSFVNPLDLGLWFTISVFSSVSAVVTTAGRHCVHIEHFSDHTDRFLPYLLPVHSEPFGQNYTTHCYSTCAETMLLNNLNKLNPYSLNDPQTNPTRQDYPTAELPGLNTFGISMARIDFAPMGINPPHMHPRASEILTVIEGRILVGFVTSNPENRLITKILEKGDVFVFPQGLIHFQKNLENKYAVAIAGLSSQNPGVITIANAVFGSNPDIPGDILAKAFQVDVKFVYQIQSKF